MSLWDTIVDFFEGLFDKNKNEPVSTNQRGQKKSRMKQVYASACSQRPDWAEATDQSLLIEACMKHVKCKYVPHIEFKKIMSTRQGLDGNLESEYEGIAADCGAVKNFGMQVAKYDEMLQAYRYVNLDHIFTACCGTPRRCPFFLAAEGESFDLNRKLKDVPLNQGK